MHHFLFILEDTYGLSPTNRHLLILDGYKSYVTLEVIKLAKSKELDLLTFPSHTSHTLQPLNVTCFKPFKLAFRAYRDKWTVGHKGQMSIKEDSKWIEESVICLLI